VEKEILGEAYQRSREHRCMREATESVILKGRKRTHNGWFHTRYFSGESYLSWDKTVDCAKCCVGHPVKIIGETCGACYPQHITRSRAILLV